MVDTWNDEGKVSQWNEAMFKMKRLHELQTEINRVKMDLLSKHYLANKWNYEVWFSSVVALYYEGAAKYKPDEKVEILKLKTAIEELFKYFPVHSLKKSIKMNGGTQTYVLKEDNWLKIKKLIEILEDSVKFYNDEHGLSTMNKENVDGYSIIR